MRVEYHAAADVDRSPALRSYAETRVWLAARRAARGPGRRRPTWAGVTVTRRDGGAGRPGVACQVDAWLRGVGLVTVRQAGDEPRDVIECASVRLGHAIRRRFAGLTRPARPPEDGGGILAGVRPPPPRLAVLVKPPGCRRSSASGVGLPRGTA